MARAAKVGKDTDGLPEAAVCDRHQDVRASRLVEAPDGRGDCYLCDTCYADHLAGLAALPYLRHSPSIRRRHAVDVPHRRQPIRRTVWPKRTGVPLESPAFLHALFAHADESISLIDRAGTILAAVGPPGGVLGHLDRTGIVEFVHPEDLSMAYAKIAETVETPGGEVSFRLRARHADGSMRTLELRAFNRLHDPLFGGVVIRTREAS
jgi:hypothetical protein